MRQTTRPGQRPDEIALDPTPGLPRGCDRARRGGSEGWHLILSPEIDPDRR
jgi:hypothetical protein